MLKIALYNLTTTTKHGGVESFVWEIARRLADRGHDVTLFGGRGDVLRPYSNLTVLRYPYIARETWGRVPPLRKSLNLLKLLERLSMAARALPDLVAGRFDIIQVSKPYDFPVGARARRLSGARLLYNSQGTDFFPGDVLFRRSVDGAFACSRYNATMVEQHFRIPLAVSYNGFDELTFRPLPPSPALRARLAPDGAPLLLYVGRLVTFKGLDHLLDAVALLSVVRRPSSVVEGNGRRTMDNRLPPRLLLAGDGPHRAGLERRARALGIADRVTFLGPIANTELPRYHAASDVFVVPSTDHETFCIAACEAMACARPVVAARTGGLPEVVRDGETGYLAPPADAHALAERIGALLDDVALRERMGAAGRAWALEMFTWERVVERVLGCYERALASKRGVLSGSGP
ncbi:MAG: glycosyltransferase family 4 protein [Roseiflexaceae bacterium]